MAKETSKDAKAVETKVAETKTEDVQELASKETSKDDKMAGNIGNNVETAGMQGQKKEKKTAPESCYPVSELAANAKTVFGTRRECVTAALNASGKTEYTISEAKEIVEKFLKRKVK